MKKMVPFFLLAAITCLGIGNGFAEEVFQIFTPNRLTNIDYQLLEDDRLLVSVADDAGEPVRGLTQENFVVQKGAKKAILLSVKPLETSEDVGLNLVFVVDNSVSMKHRKAVGPLLFALEEFFKILRPIDDVHVVVFDQKGGQPVGEWMCHTKDLRTNDATQLKQFFEAGFDAGLTDKTYLYEAILKGVDITQKMPEKKNKLLVIFSDGEDINSAFGRGVVESASAKVRNLKVYAIDYMPTAMPDPFLKSLADVHGGKLWKASSATALLPIFRDFSTSLRHQYVVAYRILDPPTGILNMGPADLHLEELTLLDGSPLGNMVFFETGRSDIPEWYTLFSDKADTAAFDETQLRTALDRYRHVLNLVGKRLAGHPELRARIVGCNASVGLEKDNVALSRKRAEAVNGYLNQVWGVDPQQVVIEARNLPEHFALPDILGSRAENQRVEIFYEDHALQMASAGDFVAEMNGIQAIQVQPDIMAEYGLARWELSISAGGEPIKTLQGADDLEGLYAFSLDELGRRRLAGSQFVEASINVADVHGDAYETTTASHIVVSTKPVIHELILPPSGTLTMAPTNITIEELTTIDSSPLLNYVFFDTAESEIQDRYVLFANQAEAASFDESRLKGAMEKYRHVLNILGKRLMFSPDVHCTIVGCNADYGPEKGRTDLSQGRAEAVRAYLRYIWGVDASRMDVEVRNLPAAPSTSRIDEGRVENQRVEILSDVPEILDVTKSTYVEEISDADVLEITPRINAGYGVKQWRLNLKGDGMLFDTRSGFGDLEPVYNIALKEIGLGKIGSFENILAEIEVVDEKDQAIKVVGPSASVRFIKRQERVAQKVGYKVLEKYALILFDYDSSEIKGRNRVIVDGIVERLKAIPGAVVNIVGHTDNIGQEEYNLALSQRRANAVYRQMLDAGMKPGENIICEGVGPNDSLYDNTLPEGRAFNRTVTVSLEYEQP